MLQARPLLALPDGTVIAGNQRLRAARELGWQTIPVVTVSLERERARLWALRDNNSYGEWEEQALAELLAELGEGGVDLDRVDHADRAARVMKNPAATMGGQASRNERCGATARDLVPGRRYGHSFSAGPVEALWSRRAPRPSTRPRPPARVAWSAGGGRGDVMVVRLAGPC
jgi:hypothetical protein